MSRAGKSYEYNVLCDICGFKFKNHQLRLRWDGFWACDEDWEPRNILDFYQTRNDTHKLPYIRSDNDGIDVGPPINPGTITPVPCNATAKLAIPNVGKAGCMIAGNTTDWPYPT